MRYYQFAAIKEVYDNNNVYEDFPGEVQKMQNLEDQNKLTKIGSILKYDVKCDSNQEDFCLCYSSTVVSFLGIILANMYNKPMITFTWTLKELRGTGLLKSLINFYVNKFGVLYCDQSHSFEAKEMWKSILRNGLGNLKIYVLDLSTNKEELYDSKNHTEDFIWNDNNSDIILGLKR